MKRNGIKLIALIVLAVLSVSVIGFAKTGSFHGFFASLSLNNLVYGYGGGGVSYGSSSMDYCVGGDHSPSYYDGDCGTATTTEEDTNNDTNNANDNNYSDELTQAYQYAHRIGITTMPTIGQANLGGALTRADMAKMMANYAMNVLGLEPDTEADCTFDDVVGQSTEMTRYIRLACQLHIMMGIGNDNFNPNGGVDRGQFATALSRALWGGQYNTEGSAFYTNHLQALKSHGIIKNTTPSLQELRGNVMLMMMRADK